MHYHTIGRSCSGAAACSAFCSCRRQVHFLIAVFVLLSAAAANAQPFSPYSDFQAMTPDELVNLQVKLTYVGLTEGPIPTVAFTATGKPLDLAKFVPFRRPGIPYASDEISVKSFAATTEQLKAVIDQVGSLPNVTAGGLAPNRYLSFGLWNMVASGEKGFEAVLNVADTTALYTALRSALSGNDDGLRLINESTCFLFVLEPGVPTDVTAGVPVTFSGVRLNRATGRYVGTAVATNNSGGALTGPLSLVLNLPPGVSLFNATGQTCGTSPEGRDYINFPLTGNMLPPGQTAQVMLDYQNPNGIPIVPTKKVLAGPGAR